MPGIDDDGIDGEFLEEGLEEEKKAVLRLSEKAKKGDAALEQVRLEPNLVKRGRALAALEAVNFPEVSKVKMGDGYAYKTVSTDVNRWAAFEALFGTGRGRPHLDTFSGKLVDHEGRHIDDHYPVVELIHALAAMGLKTQEAATVRKSFREWAMYVRFNDLIEHVNDSMPDWDQVPRLDTRLIEFFETFDTPLNREFGRYFWLSIYCRAMYPGCLAPCALSLFGPQNAGKSYFSKRICEALIGRQSANAVQLDLSKDPTTFLRKITGHSVVANVGEMTGFGESDLNKIKSFMTMTSDMMDYKFEGHFEQARQWITIMDGNKYVGLQRDDTGNRRFYPMFAAQIPDVDGQPAWKPNGQFSANFDGFDWIFWQIMAECREWLNLNDGIEGYERFTSTVTKHVEEFSKSEMNRDRGTVRDDYLDMYLRKALENVPKKTVSGYKKSGVFFEIAELNLALKAIDHRGTLKLNHLKNKLAALGGVPEVITNKRGYLFHETKTVEEFAAMLRGTDDDDLTIIDEVPDPEPESF